MRLVLKIISIHILAAFLLGFIYLYFSEDITILLFSTAYSEVQWSMVIIIGFAVILVCCSIAAIRSIMKNKEQPSNK
jgi:uncharacterized membrane protein